MLVGVKGTIYVDETGVCGDSLWPKNVCGGVCRDLIVDQSTGKSNKRKAVDLCKQFIFNGLESHVFATKRARRINEDFFSRRPDPVITVLTNVELLNRIFSHVDMHTLNSCRRVSRIWNSVADISMHNVSFPLNYVNNSSDTVQQLFEMHPFWLMAQMNNANNSSDTVRQLLEMHPVWLVALKEAKIEYFANIAKSIGWIALFTIAEVALIALERWQALRNAKLTAEEVLERVNQWNATRNIINRWDVINLPDEVQHIFLIGRHNSSCR